jgi:hypothetical protein
MTEVGLVLVSGFLLFQDRVDGIMSVCVRGRDHIVRQEAGKIQGPGDLKKFFNNNLLS